MKKTYLLLIVIIIALTLFGCKSKKASIIKVGLSFSDFATERWPLEQALMTKLLYKAGAQVFSQVANNNAELQNDQIENLVLQGVNVIIIIAKDGTKCASAVEKAYESHVPCIAYDRLIMTDKLAAYISFNNVEVGRQQARGVLKIKNKGKFFLLGGSPTDNNAHLFRKGQMEIIQPLIKSGDITIVGEGWADNWNPSIAAKIMEDFLSVKKNKLDAIIASNDGTALGAIQILKEYDLAGKIPISGQDASPAGCKSIIEGELTMTVFKDIRLLTPMAIDIALKLAKGEKINGLINFKLSEVTTDEKLTGKVPCKFLDVVQVDKSNIYDVVIKSGFQNWDEVYKNVPEKDRPPKPEL